MKLKKLKDKEEILKAERKTKKTNCRQRNNYSMYRRLHVSKTDIRKQ